MKRASLFLLEHTELEDGVETFNSNFEEQRGFSSDFTPRPAVKTEPREATNGGQEDAETALAGSKEVNPPVIKKENESRETPVPQSVAKSSQKRSERHPTVAKTPEHLR